MPVVNDGLCQGGSVTLGTVLVRRSRLATSGRAPTISPTAGIRRGLLAMALTWQVLAVGLDPENWPSAQPGMVSGILLALIPVTWFGGVALLWVRTTSPWVGPACFAANVLALLLAGLSLTMASGEQALRSGAWVPGASLISVAAGVAGMLLSASAAWSVIAVASVSQVVLIAIAMKSGLWPTLVADLVLYPLYLIAIGAAAIGARRALLHAAGQHEDALDAVELARARSAALASVRRLLARQERRIHETVLNTLSAIAGGALGADPASTARIRAAARESAAVLRSIDRITADGLGSRDRPWRADLLPSFDRLAAQGISTTLAVHSDVVLPEATYQALLVATREALSNAQRHSGAASVGVTVSLSESSAADGSDEVRVVIEDDGRGFDPSATPMRFGVEESITRALIEAGGQAHITSAIGHGTVVILRCPIDRGSNQASRSTSLVEPVWETGDDTIPRTNAAFARPVLGWFGVYVLASALLTARMVGWTQDSLGSLMLVATLAVALWILSARAMLTGWFVLATAVVAPAAYAMQQPVITSADVHWADWTSQGLAVIWLVVTAIGPWWSIWLALASWKITQGDPLHELVQPGTAIIVAGAIFARTVRRHSRLIGQAAHDRAAELAQALAEEDGLRRMQLRHGLLDESGALQTLDGIGSGWLDPQAEPVRRLCGIEERYVRAVMRLDPGADLVHERAGRLAVHARRRGISIEMDLSDTAGWHEDACGRFFDQADQAISLADTSAPARLSARREGPALVLRLVAGNGIDVIEARDG